MTACRICGRELVDYRKTDANDPAMDCGGDCWGCIREIEEGMGMRRSDPGDPGGRHTFALFSDSGNMLDCFDTLAEASRALDDMSAVAGLPNPDIGLLEFDARGMCVRRHWPPVVGHRIAFLNWRGNRLSYAWVNRCWRCLLDPFHGDAA